MTSIMLRFARIALFLVPLAAAAQTAPSYQGLWWRSPAGSESGWGVNLTHQGNILFATWFTYDAQGTGIWLVMPRGELTPDQQQPDPYGYPMMRSQFEYEGPLYRTTGPAFNAPSFNPAVVNALEVGHANFRFSSADNGVFTYTVNGVTQAKAITRQVFGTMPVCDFSGTPSANFQDLWWRAPAGSESGWGLNVAQQGDTVFATWFTYDATGKGLWLVVPSATRSGGNTFSGQLYRTTGPAFDSATWDASRVQGTVVGNATLAFGDAANGTFTATVDGATVSKAITRQVFASPATVCR